MEIDPPVRLAVTYVPVRFRFAFALLLRVDKRFAAIVRAARDPMIAQIKMAWWREAFEKAPHLRPKGEPLLNALNEVGDVIPLPALEALIAAWEPLLGSEPWSQQVIDRHTEFRATAVFQTYAQWMDNTQDVRPIGQVWALEDLRRMFPDRVPHEVCIQHADLPKAWALRPLSILTMSLLTASGPRLIWHALTGR